MTVEIGGIIEEMHEDEEGRRIIDKVKIEYLSLVPDNGVVDALKFLSDDYIVRMPPVREYTVRAKIKSIEKGVPRFAGLEDEVMDAMEICRWDELSDEALENFEGLLAELRLKAYVGNEALEEFEELIRESEPPVDYELSDCTVDGWTDWLIGDADEG